MDAACKSVSLNVRLCDSRIALRSIRATLAKKGAAEKQKEQSEWFIKAARELGLDETGKYLEQAVKRISPRKNSDQRD